MTLPLSKLGARLLIAFLVIFLAGCKEDFALLDDIGNIVGTGSLELTANFPSPAHLTFDGKEYTGQWSTTDIYEADLDKSRRLMGERAYLANQFGGDHRQLKHGHASLTAGNGSKVSCDFFYRIQPDQGSCDIDGKHLTLTVAQWW